MVWPWDSMGRPSFRHSMAQTELEMSKFIEDHHKELALQRLTEICQPFEIWYARAAFYGDVEAAFGLCAALNNDLRGQVAVAMWRAKVPREAFQMYLGLAWDHDHERVIDAAKTRRNLSHMFRYAAFPPSAELPEIVTLWRGTSRLTFDEAKTGYSWTTDRDTACWFAMRNSHLKNFHSPLVLTSDAPKTDVALFHDERREKEVVLLRLRAGAIVDGDVCDWRKAAAERAKVKMTTKSQLVRNDDAAASNALSPSS